MWGAGVTEHRRPHSLEGDHLLERLGFRASGLQCVFPWSPGVGFRAQGGVGFPVFGFRVSDLCFLGNRVSGSGLREGLDFRFLRFGFPVSISSVIGFRVQGSGFRAYHQQPSTLISSGSTFFRGHRYS